MVAPYAAIIWEVMQPAPEAGIDQILWHQLFALLFQTDAAPHFTLLLSVFLQMCIAGALGIPGSAPRRTQRRNCFVSSKNGLPMTSWG